MTKRLLSGLEGDTVTNEGGIPIMSCDCYYKDGHPGLPIVWVSFVFCLPSSPLFLFQIFLLLI